MKITIELELEQARQAALGHPLGFMAREIIHESIYRAEALEKGQPWPDPSLGSDEDPYEGVDEIEGFDIDLARRLHAAGRPPWHLVLPALREVEAALSIEDAFDDGTVESFEDWRRGLEDVLSKLEFSFSEWGLYHGFLFCTTMTDLLEKARSRGNCSPGTVHASARVGRMVCLALGHYLPGDLT